MTEREAEPGKEPEHGEPDPLDALHDETLALVERSTAEMESLCEKLEADTRGLRR